MRWFLRGHHRSVPALTNQPQLNENAHKNSQKIQVNGWNSDRHQRNTILECKEIHPEIHMEIHMEIPTEMHI